MMQKSKHKLEKELKRAERHKEWLRKNLPNTKIERENQKLLFQTYTELAVIKLKS
jgi:hypothetical protein